jgi:hypothetical protein
MGAVKKIGMATGVLKKKTKPTTASMPSTAPATAAARDQGEEAEAAVETEGTGMKKRRRGKKALVTQTAAANVGGEGGSGLNIPVA